MMHKKYLSSIICYLMISSSATANSDSINAALNAASNALNEYKRRPNEEGWHGPVGAALSAASSTYSAAEKQRLKEENDLASRVLIYQAIEQQNQALAEERAFYKKQLDELYTLDCKKLHQHFRGCCSHHGGVLGCADYKVYCNDDTISKTCKCTVPKCVAY